MINISDLRRFMVVAWSSKYFFNFSIWDVMMLLQLEYVVTEFLSFWLSLLSIPMYPIAGKGTEWHARISEPPPSPQKKSCLDVFEKSVLKHRHQKEGGCSLLFPKALKALALSEPLVFTSHIRLHMMLIFSFSLHLITVSLSFGLRWIKMLENRAIRV